MTQERYPKKIHAVKNRSRARYKIKGYFYKLSPGYHYLYIEI